VEVDGGVSYLMPVAFGSILQRRAVGRASSAAGARAAHAASMYGVLCSSNEHARQVERRARMSEFQRMPTAIYWRGGRGCQLNDNEEGAQRYEMRAFLCAQHRYTCVLRRVDSHPSARLVRSTKPPEQTQQDFKVSRVSFIQSFIQS